MGEHSSHRERATLDMLRALGGSSRTAELANALNVSEETVRRNVKRLAGQGLAVRVHGGVFLTAQNGEPAFRARLNAQKGAKRRIGQAVAAIIPNGASLFLDTGTTSIYVAEALAARKNLTIITNSLEVAWRLGRDAAHQVMLAGGALRASDGGAYGAEAMDYLRRFTPDFAIVSVAGITVQGFGQFDAAEADLGRVMLAQARTVIAVADATKFERNAPISLGEPGQFALLVTDQPAPEPIAKAALHWGVDLHIAPPKLKDAK